MKTFLKHPFWIRLRHWEYWSSRLVYLPLYPYWLWLSLRARSFFFLSAANPSIRNGGFIMERKSEVYALLPPGSYPATCYCPAGTDSVTAHSLLGSKGLRYPLIAKPDIGERGLGVRKLHSQAELETYIARIPGAFLLQEYIDRGQEAGIFYCRLPGSSCGHISGITGKYPVAVTGDGLRPVRALALAVDRYVLQWKQIGNLDPAILERVPAEGERVVLLPYGNHSRGSLFLDESRRITPSLNAAVERVCKDIPGFFYGRLDVKFDSWEQLEADGDFSIIELNGSGSEPVHIYDPAHSLPFAWREIIRHWRMLYRVSALNHRQGVPYPGLLDGWREIRAFRKLERQLVCLTD